MTRIRSTLFMALVGLSALAIATAEAQQRSGPQRAGGPGQGGRPGGGGGFRISNAQLLNVEKVRTEAGVSETEWKKIQALAEQNREGGDRDAMRERFSKMREMTDEQRAEEMKKMGEERAKREQERAKQLTTILSASKIARINQIRIQLSGFDILGTPEVAGKLKISPGQGEKLKAIRAKMQEKSEQMREGFRNGGGAGGEDRMAQMREMMGKMRQMQKDALNEAVDTVMTPSQKEIWKEMNGKPFEIEMSDLMQGRGPGGPGGRGPGGEGAGGRGPAGRGAGGRGQGGGGPRSN